LAVQAAKSARAQQQSPSVAATTGCTHTAHHAAVQRSLDIGRLSPPTTPPKSFQPAKLPARGVSRRASTGLDAGARAEARRAVSGPPVPKLRQEFSCPGLLEDMPRRVLLRVRLREMVPGGPRSACGATSGVAGSWMAAASELQLAVASAVSFSASSAVASARPDL